MDSKSWTAAGIVLGIGVGGFVDGIVAHQLVEWHHMLSGWYPIAGDHNMRVDMVGDALFHLFSLAVVLVGIGLLARARPPEHRGRRLVGWTVAGAWLGRARPETAGTGDTGTGGPVQREHLRRLLDSDLPEPVLVLRTGRAEVVPADEQERAGYPIVSRAELLRQTGKTTFTDAELDQRATTLSTTLANLGG